MAKVGPPLEVDGRQYYHLPQGPKLPVLVATRMSLSFPLLISAVPLHEPSRRERRCEPTAPAADQEHNVADSMEGLTSARWLTPCATTVPPPMPG